MARVKKAKPTLESICFVTPEQKLLRFLLSEPTTSFTPRVLSSKLKGVRGLGGVEGIVRILKDLQEAGFVQFIDNNRSVCLHNDCLPIQLMKILSAICDLEGLQTLVEPVSSRGVVFGSRAKGLARSDSNYNLFIVSDNTDEVRKIVTSHPLGKRVALIVCSGDDYLDIEQNDPDLAKQVNKGFVMWSSAW